MGAEKGGGEDHCPSLDFEVQLIILSLSVMILKTILKLILPN